MYGIEKWETPRLLLSRPVESEFDDYARLLGDPQVGAMLGGVRDRVQAREFFDRQLAHWVAFGFGLWTLRDRANGEFVGRGGCRTVLLEGRPEPELGYTLLPQFWGRGLATELACEAVRVGFDVIGFHEIVAFTLPTNAASRRVMEKAGLSYERDGDFMGFGQVIYRRVK